MLRRVAEGCFYLVVGLVMLVAVAVCSLWACLTCSCKQCDSCPIVGGSVSAD